MTLVLWLISGLAALAVAGAGFAALQSRAINAAFPPQGRLVRVEGGVLHVIDTGPAGASAERTVVLLHGASGNARDMMAALGDRLAQEGYRVLAPDRPGHGWSDRPGGRADASPARQAVVIRQALASLGVTRAIVVGHSWSGALATNFALDHADMVAGLVLLAPVTHPWPGGVTWYYGPTLWPGLGFVFSHIIMPPVARLVIQGAVDTVFLPQKAPVDYIERTGARLVLRPSEFRANAEDVYDLHRFVTTQATRYTAIRTPTVILAGDADDVVWTRLHSESLARQVPGAKLTVISGMGHMVHHLATETILAEIRALSASWAAKELVHKP